MKPRFLSSAFAEKTVPAAHLDPNGLGCLTGRVIGWVLGSSSGANDEGSWNHIHYVRAYRELQAESNDQRSR